MSHSSESALESQAVVLLRARRKGHNGHTAQTSCVTRNVRGPGRRECPCLASIEQSATHHLRDAAWLSFPDLAKFFRPGLAIAHKQTAAASA